MKMQSQADDLPAKFKLLLYSMNKTENLIER